MLRNLLLPLALAIPQDPAPDLSELPALEGPLVGPAGVDYLVERVERPAGVYRSADGRELVLDNGLVRRAFRVAPNAACVELRNLATGKHLLRAVRPEAVVVIDGHEVPVGGLQEQPNHAFLTREWLDGMERIPGSLQLAGFEVGPIEERFAWKRVRHHAPDVAWPPVGVHLRMDYAPLAGELPGELESLRVSVHYELYQGVPVLSKWLTVTHAGRGEEGARPFTVERFQAEMLAVVEHDSRVETREGVALPAPRSLHVETDFAFGGMTAANANRHAVHWRADPQYTTQVNYLKRQPCLLVVEPTYGPAQEVRPGETFETCRVFELVHDGTERERRGLAVRRMYRTIAPWVTENPLMHHMRLAEPDAVRRAIDEAAEVGFEMVILSFGSGFDMEREDPDYLAEWRAVANHARAKGVELGAYSLFSSRSIGGGNDIVSPEGQRPTHGSCPAVTSAWGLEYMRKLYAFFPATGFTLLEHDGPYPGDVDVTPRPPFQKGEQDSRWVQWRMVTDFYKWCRAQGVYLNAPDYYYLAGSNKCGMGYREVNWSLPRAQQVLHTRQNIFDGTWTKTPSMGWMFVPLTEYHGGGAAATIEPLDEHRKHYDRMLVSNLAYGVQACYRGPRLFDTERTKQLVKHRVAWFKEHREVLEADVVHGRRADGRQVDWMLHVNPHGEERGMLVVFNPLAEPVETVLDVNLYYTGVSQRALLAREGGADVALELDRRYRVRVPVDLVPGGWTWFSIRGE